MRARLSAWGLGTLLRRLLRVRLGRLHQYPPRPLSVSRIDVPADDSDLPCISLVTPSFNHARFIGETIQSVVGQAYPHLQYVVQDACSTDGTADVLRPFSGKGVDIRVEPDNGQADALNRGFARTTGEVMGYLNSDDLLLPGALHYVGRYFRDNPSVDVIYGNRLIINEDGLEIGRWILPGHDSLVLRFVDYVPQESMFWRRRIWDRAGGRLDANLHFAMDWDLILRFLDAGAVFHHVPELLGVFRAHGKQKSQADFVVRGAGEMATLRSQYSKRRIDDVKLAAHHWRYLSRHRQADASFAAGLYACSNGTPCSPPPAQQG